MLQEDFDEKLPMLWCGTLTRSQISWPDEDMLDWRVRGDILEGVHEVFY